MAKFNFFLQELVYEADSLSVIINCGPDRPGELEDMGPGHPVYDFARRILEGKLAEQRWIDGQGEPNGCDLDLRTLIGQDGNRPNHYFFCLACLRLPKGTLDGEDDCFRKLAPDEMADDTGPEKFNVVESGTLPEPDLPVPADDGDDMDTRGKHTLEDLLGGL